MGFFSVMRVARLQCHPFRLLCFSGPPQVKQSAPPRVVKPVGEEEVKLLCNVKDAQNYTWYRNGKTILQPSGRYTVKKDRFLRIIGRVQKSDSGVFVCVATNNYGSANCTVRLIVEGMTSFSLGSSKLI